MSLKDQILNAQDIPSRIVDVPEWGVKVDVRGMTGGDRTAIYEAAFVDGEVNLAAFYPEVVIATAHDPDTGERIFDASDKAALMLKSGKALDRIAEAGLELSGMTEDARTEMGKDSSTTANAG